MKVYVMCDILKMDNALLEVFEHDKSFQVHSMFDKVINLSHSTSPFLWSIMPENIDNYPRTIMVNNDIFFMLKKVIRTGETITIKKQTIQLKNIVLSYQNTTPYTVLKISDKTINVSKWRLLYQQSLYLTQKNGFGNYVYYPNKRIILLLNGDMSQLTYFLGRGIGLTPTGDDMLLGVIFVLSLLPQKKQLLHQITKQLQSLLQQNMTTDVSRHYLSLALCGVFSPPIQKLSQFLTSDSNLLVTTILKQMMSFGHSSGCDTLTSILTTLNHFVVE